MSNSRTEKNAEEKSQIPMKTGIWITFYVILSGILLQHIIILAWQSAQSYMQKISAISGIISFTVILLFGSLKKYRKFLGSVRFAVPVISFITIFCIIGTVVLQGVSQEAFSEIYGSYLSWFFQMLHFQDVFHSISFCMVMGMGAGGALLALFPLKPVTILRTGKLLAHLSIAVILAGSSAGSLWGIKGQIGLMKGQSTNHFITRQSDKSGIKTVPLGFTVKLEDFKIEYYKKSIRLRIFNVSDKEPKLIFSIDPSRKSEWKKLSRVNATILNYWPHFVQIVHAVPVQSEEENQTVKLSALGITTEIGTGGTKVNQEEVKWLFVEPALQPAKLAIPGKGELLFFWNENDASEYVKKLSDEQTEQHIIVTDNKKINVKIGESYPITLKDGRIFNLVIREFYNDFVIDMETKKPSNRSDKPDNPAIRVDVQNTEGEKIEEGWLFAKFSSFHSTKQDSILSTLKYIYTGKTDKMDKTEPKLLIIGKTPQTWFVSGGNVSEKRVIHSRENEEIKEFGIRIVSILEHAKPVTEYKSASSEPVNPAVEVSFDGENGSHILTIDQPYRFSENKVIVLSEQEENIKDYLSKVSIIKEGKTVVTKILEVNHPLIYGGYSFYQANYDPDKPGWSGIEVVKDPGILIVYAGLIMMLAGVVTVIFIAPLARTRKHQSGEGNRGGT